MVLLVVQLVLALLTLNALRPPRNAYVGAVSSPFGMAVSELAPWFTALTVLDVVVHLLVQGPDGWGAPGWVGVGVAVLNVAGLLLLVRRSGRVAAATREALAPLGITVTPRQGRPGWVAPFAAPSLDLHTTKNLAYGDAPRKRNLLNLHLPEADAPGGGPRPVLLQIHGGTWMYGNKDQQGKPLLDAMVQRGWIGVSINYRLSPVDRWPAHIQDVKAAIAWVKEHIGSHGGDPDHVVLTGGSAGGHLSALAALTPGDPAFQPGFEDVDTSVAGCVPLYGVYDLAALSDLPTAPGLMEFVGKRIFDKDPVADHAEFVAASPLSRVTDTAPDFFVLHGEQDTTADIGHSVALVEALRATSRRSVAWCPVPYAQHMFDVFGSTRSDAVVDAVAAFLTHTHAERRAG